MPNPNNENDQNVVFNPINNSISAYANASYVLESFELFGCRRARVCG
jgi:hypothetical protein